jgi:ABC-type branched-subunit amino acid transport system ATPase component/ABC-type branched-subunit amino acid transport system permease subunit
MNLAIPIDLQPSTIVLGTITGLGYGLLSAGLVIVYRTNRIINFAQGEMGTLGAALFVLLVTRFGIPYYATLPLALVAGALMGGLSEVLVIRRLRTAPRLMSLVATLGLGQILLGLTLAVSTASRGAAVFPAPPGLPDFKVGAYLVRPAASGLLFFSPIVVVALAVFLRRSRFGLALRSAAANPEAARMAGVFASRMSTLAWAICGALSAFTAILVAPNVPGGLLTATLVGPSLLLRGLAGAIIARMTNIPLALASGVGVGVVESVLLQSFRSGGIMDATLFVIILFALLLQLREGARERETGSAWLTVQPWRPIPDQLAKLRLVRNLGWILSAVVLVPLAVLPMFLSNVTAVTLTSLLGFVMVALSVGIITGLGGQLTLGQFGLAAVGATVSALISLRFGGNPISLLFGGLAAAAVSLLIGLPALRIRGLFLAVTTLAFAIAMTNWILVQPWALGDGVSAGRPVLLGDHPIEPGRSYFYFAFAVFLLLFLISRNIRKTGFGRLLRAVRDNEDAARAFALPARRIKIQGFLLAGFIAGVGGAAYGHSFSEISLNQFAAQYSIQAVVTTVIGGIGILAGPILGVVFVRGIPDFLPLRSLAIFATNAGLLLVILYFPGGLVQLVAPLRDRLIKFLGRRRGIPWEDQEEAQAPEAPIFTRPVKAPMKEVTSSDGRSHEVEEGGSVLLEVSRVRKSYGGLTAVDDVSCLVKDGETVGIIGPNGAGKTTLFEVLAGFVTCEAGRVLFDGNDVTKWSPEKRAGAGLIRSFQDVQLFPTMTVLETIQLALERRLRTSFAESILGMSARDRAKEKLARDMVGSMGLWSFRNKQIQELSTGTRRITELACLVGLKPKLLLLDEPSSGIAQRETEALGDLLNDLKNEHGMTLVVIEHDIPMIMGLADRIVAMDAGKLIAEGPPQIVRDNPAVVEAYLGGRIEAIERSGALAQHVAATPDLNRISGLGPAKRAALLEVFGSVEAIRKASVDDISKVPGFGSALAKRVHSALR